MLYEEYVPSDLVPNEERNGGWAFDIKELNRSGGLRASISVH